MKPCARCVTPAKCGIHGCCPGTWPAETATEKSKGGRPPAPPGMRRVNVPVRLPEWMVEWMTAQWVDDPDKTATVLIEAALLKAHKLRPPRAL